MAGRNYFDFRKQVVIVTGAGGSIGSAYARGFSECGARVVAADIRTERAREVVKGLTDSTEHLAAAVDVTCPESIAEMVNQVMQRYGRIDVLVNHAGLNIRKPALDYLETDWQKIVDTNLKGIFFVAQKVGKVMVDQKKGRIINTASVSAVRGHPHLSVYAATKGGIMQLTRVLAIEWAPYNVHVNAIGPGYIHTEQTHQYLQNPETYNSIVSKIPLNRVGEPEDLVGPALFLASPAAGYITGHTLFVEGGRLID